MARLYFHCSTAREALIDPTGIVLRDLAEAREHAAQFVRSLIASPSLEDWRNWVLHVSDAHGDEVFAVAFASAVGKPN